MRIEAGLGGHIPGLDILPFLDSYILQWPLKLFTFCDSFQWPFSATAGPMDLGLSVFLWKNCTLSVGATVPNHTS